MRTNSKFRFTQNVETDKSILWYGQFPLFIFTRKAFNDIKKLLINPPVLKAPTPDGLFHLESDTSQEGVGGILLQKQGNKWVVIGYHSKRLPQFTKNFGVTELELTALLVNIHGFMQLLCNRYFEVLFNHKAIKYMIKSKTKSPLQDLKHYC